MDALLYDVIGYTSEIHCLSGLIMKIAVQLDLVEETILTPTFTWTESDDEDLYDVIGYTLKWYKR